MDKTEVDALKVPGCPACGSTEIVRFFRAPLSVGAHKARCVACGAEFKVSRAAWEALRDPRLDEVRERWSERLSYPLHAKMTKPQIAATTVGAVVGFLLAIWTNHAEIALVMIVGSWWLSWFATKAWRSR